MGEAETEMVNMQDFIFGRTPDSREAERRLQFSEDLDTNPLAAERIDENGRARKKSQARSLSSRIAEGVQTSRLCRGKKKLH